LSESDGQADAASRIPLRRRLIYHSIIYLAIIALLGAIEIGTRLLRLHLSSLELFVNTSQQKAQIAENEQSSIFEGDPLLLWRLKPNLHNAVWDFTVVTTNAEGFRVEKPVGPHRPGAFRIVCLGDSVTFGYRVPPVWPNRPADFDPAAQPYPALLERTLAAANPGRQIEVINMAVPGYSSRQGLAWLRRDIDQLAPDVLVVSFGWNDASISDAPDSETIRTDRSVVAVRWLIDHSQAFAHATRWLRTHRNHESADPKPGPRVPLAEYLENMTAIVQEAQSRGGNVVVMAAPYRDERTNPPEAQRMNQYRDALAAAMKERRVPFLQILELTTAAYPANEGWFGELIHPNEYGHRLIALEMMKLFAAQGSLRDLKVPALSLGGDW